MATMLSGAVGCATDPAAGGDEEADASATPSDGLGSGNPLVEPPPGADPPVLVDVSARVAGRYGDDIVLTVQGEDPDRDALALAILAQSGSANVDAFDVVRDGVLDAAETVAVLAADVRRRTEWETRVTFRGLAAKVAGISHLTVELQDATGLRSGALRVAVVDQPERAVGAACDPESILDRCPTGAGCVGDPAICEAGQPPEITRLAYVPGADARLLIEAYEPDGDLESVYLEFFDADGEPVSLDLDSDGLPDASSFTVEATGALPGADVGDFFIGVQTAGGVGDIVKSIAATPKDASGQEGERIEVELKAVRILGNGKTCDPHGFELCQTSSICIPTTTGSTHKCVNALTARKTACDDAPVLTPVAGGQMITYAPTLGASYWEAPEGCAAAQGTGLPDAAFRLEVPDDVATLTLTTDLPGTDVDTILYVVAETCPRSGAEALACNDDNDRSVGSTVVLNDVDAGSYLVIVDSWEPLGGGIAVGVTIE